MEKIRITVLVSGGGTNLQALIDSVKSGVIADGEIVEVISNASGAYALTRAREANIPTAVVTKKEYGEGFEEALIAELKRVNAELVVLAGFLSILGERFVSEFKERAINVHPSLIPSFCGKGYYGLKVHASALDYGVRVTGATVHYVDVVPDGGKIIMQKAVDVLDGDTPEVLQKRVMEQAEWVILPEATQTVCKKLLKERI